MLKSQAARVVLFLFLFLFLSLVRAQEEEESVQSYILDLSDTNFTEHVKDKGEWLVEFYAPWCSACNRFAPHYDLTARAIQQWDPSIKFARVNVDKNPGLGSQFFVVRLPTFYHIKDNQVREARIRLDTSKGAIDFLQHQEWKDVKVWGGFFSPFSVFARTMNLVGRAATYIAAHGDDIKNGAFLIAAAWFGYVILNRLVATVFSRPATPATVVGVDVAKKNE